MQGAQDRLLPGSLPAVEAGFFPYDPAGSLAEIVP